MSEDASDSDSQNTELDVLSSIYGADFTLHQDKTIDMRICCDKEKWWAVTVSIHLPPGYPSGEPPVFEIHTECLSGEELQHIRNTLNDLWKENFGSSILYIWVEKIREILFEKYELAKLFIESSEDERARECKYAVYF